MLEEYSPARDDVFISYSRDQSGQAEMLANYLSDVGFRVFWDPEIDDFSKWNQFLQRKIDECSVIVVCWSKSAIRSKWVNWEADLARQAGKYLPITFDGDRPYGDSEYQIRSLRNWHASIRPREAQALAKSIAHRLKEARGYDIQLAKQRIEDYATARRLSTTWFALMLVTLYYSISAWMASQNDGISPLGFLIDARPIQGSLISLFLVGVLTAISYRVLHRHVAYHLGETWLKKLPQTFHEPRNAGDSLVRYFGVLKVFGAVFPVAAMIHFIDKIFSYGAVARCNKSGLVESINPWSLPDIPSELTGHVFCFGHGLEDAARNGVTFIPFLEPMIVAALCIWVIYEVIRTLRLLFKKAG